MAKFFLLSIISWCAGVLICFILLNLFIRISIENPMHIFMWSFGGLFSVAGFIIALILRVKKEEMDKLTKAIELVDKQKASNDDIKRIECQLTPIYEALKYNSQCIEEMHATIDDYYKANIENNKQILLTIQTYINPKKK